MQELCLSLARFAHKKRAIPHQSNRYNKLCKLDRLTFAGDPRVALLRERLDTNSMKRPERRLLLAASGS